MYIHLSRLVGALLHIYINAQWWIRPLNFSSISIFLIMQLPLPLLVVLLSLLHLVVHQQARSL
jgi:hypothetical protein